jgi:hypothetical protein
MTLKLEPVRVATGSNDQDGLLVFAGAVLVAVLVRLSDEHGDQEGWWFLEAGFRLVDGSDQPVFATLDDAKQWIEARLPGVRLVDR